MSFLKGQPSWNKGLKIKETHPQMGFQKGHTFFNDQRVKETQFKKGESGSPTTQFKKGRAPWNKGKKGTFKHTEEHKQYMREILSGEKNVNWIKDRSKLKKDRLQAYDYAYKNWMRQVKLRDSWKCCLADETCSKRLEAHHILNWIDFPELRYEIKNGITLCHARHPRKRAEEKRLIPFFQGLVSVSSKIICLA